jgi:hypothetical protein
VQGNLKVLERANKANGILGVQDDLPGSVCARLAKPVNNVL